MFLRMTLRKKDGKTHECWSVAENKRVTGGRVVQLRLSEMRLCRARQWGACWLAGQLWRDLQLDRFWADRLPPELTARSALRETRRRADDRCPSADD
jgi:phytoene dehydrogenase-like protein